MFARTVAARSPQRSWRRGVVAMLLTFAACSQPATEPAPQSPTEPSAAPIPDSAGKAPMSTTDSGSPSPDPKTSAATEVATFGNGCFWCTEAVLEQLDGVLDVVSGYAGGKIDAPTYEQVCTGTTDHAEVVQVTFDPKVISYATLCDWFFKSHDPTTLNRQGADEGTQYRSVIFFHSPAQQAAALEAIARAQPKWSDPIVTELTAAPKFWPAEAYHQDYFRNNPTKGYCRVMIAPKLQKLGLTGKKQ